MFRKLSFVFFLLFLVLSPTKAQVSVNIQIDSTNFFIGEQTGITLNVTLGSEQKLVLPPIRKGYELVPNVEVVDVQSPDTVYLDEGKKMDVFQKYVITAWDSLYTILPSFDVYVDEVKYSSKNLAIKVLTVDVDTTNVDQFFPANGVMAPPFMWEEWRPVLYCTFLVVFMFVVALFIYDRLRKGKPMVRIIRRKKKLPPHEVAIDEINRLKVERNWTEEDSKEYYTQLTNTLRVYIKERYDFNALEMTSEEIIQRLIQEKNEDALDELRDIFRTADLVKFAKWSTLTNENDANLMAAMEYINQTKIEIDPNAKPEPEIIKETDKQRQNQVWIMRILIFILATGILGLSIWIVWRVVDLTI